MNMIYPSKHAALALFHELFLVLNQVYACVEMLRDLKTCQIANQNLFLTLLPKYGTNTNVALSHK